jgi:hypothetical protein
MKKQYLQNISIVLIVINVYVLLYLLLSKKEYSTPVFSAETSLGELFKVDTDAERKPVKKVKRKRVNF